MTRSFLLFIYCIFILGCLSAQLSGTYTINQNDLTSPRNFKSFNEARDSLVIKGVNGPVVITVVSGSGPYNEIVTFDSIPGTSAINTVHFNGNGDTLKRTDNAPKWIFSVSKADYITFENIVLDSREVGYSCWNFRLNDHADHITIKNCKSLTSNANISSHRYSHVVMSFNFYGASYPTTCHNLTVESNFFKGGGYGIVLTGDSNNISNQVVIRNNTFEDCSNGISLTQFEGVEVSGNDLSRPDLTENSNFDPISLGYVRNHFKVFNNRIHSGFGSITNPFGNPTYGIVISHCVNNSPNRSLVYNNMFYDFTPIESNHSPICFYILSSTNVGFYFNTIASNNNSFNNSARNPLAFDFGGNQNVSTNIDIRNNLAALYRTSNTDNFFMRIYNTSNMVTSDRNIYFRNTGVGNYFGQYGTFSNTVVSWSSWKSQTGNEIHSDTTNPYFADAVNFDFTPRTVLGNNIGTPVPGITTDIYGNPRDPLTPDAGAIEFEPSLYETGLHKKGGVKHCKGFVKLPVTVLNNSSDSLHAFTLSWSVNGGVVQTKTYTASIPAFDSSLILTDSIFNNGKTAVKVWISQPNGHADTYPSNDTIMDTLYARMEGYYTINSLVPTDSINFNSFTDMANRLYRHGVCGPVEIEAVPGTGPYEESFELGDIDGVNAVNTIRLNGNMETLRYPVSGISEYIIHLKKARYVTIDSLTMVVGANDIAVAVELSDSAWYNNIRYCDINLQKSLPPFNANLYGIRAISSSVLTINRQNTFSNNNIRGGFAAIYIDDFEPTTLASNPNIISNNTLIDNINRGILVLNGDHVKILRNQCRRDTSQSVANYTGIETSQGGGFEIIGNEVFSMINAIAPYNSMGIRFRSASPGISLDNICANNFIHDLKAVNNIIGIEFFNNERTTFVHNTVRVENSSLNVGTVTGLRLETIPMTSSLSNNLVSVVNNNSSISACIKFLEPGTADMDFNLYYRENKSTGITHLIQLFSIAYSDLKDWQGYYFSAMDQHSFYGDPYFRNDGLTPRNALADNTGKSTGLLTDFLLNSRNPLTPDIGAVEFTALKTNMAALSVYTDSLQVCADSNSPAIAFFQNIGSDTLFQVPVHCEVFHNSTTVIIHDTIAMIAPLDTDTVYFKPLNTSAGGIFNIRAYVALPDDSIRINDTTEIIQSKFHKIPDDFTVSDTTVCANRMFTISLPPDTKSSYRWYKTPSVGSSFHSGDQYSFAGIVTDTTVYIDKVGDTAVCFTERAPLHINLHKLTAQMSVQLFGQGKTEFTNTSMGIYNGQLWDFGDGDTASASLVQHTYSSNGTFYPLLTVYGICDTLLIGDTVVVSSVGIQQIGLQLFKIFPNPSTGKLYVEIHENTNMLVRIWSSQGGMIHEETLRNQAQNELDLSYLPDGVYFIRCTSGNGYSAIQKLVLQKDR